ncbi:hypothetical protein CONCODRAFT_70016 [Conidiobolus coronatus NRRL 28638]|uniref:Uncharacterized protein n=1 Tax=Conidiobolus coronatus (strain ATCC 28846 / CBS 209.66 / NRRL 28638) TaxID=796925 RepID=A0A137P886_CONC2|nr:hypothetical protein CONCODRAFT_70016 [Conidiobolus coronatus NRRL 28638]|eukprot:KXN71227.1 hypothetical protein CONCODRAFT_70016 [Conidiobolus coronatus NRRL 28638]
MEAELLEIRKNLSKTFKNLLELDSSINNNNNSSFNNYQGQSYNLNSSSSGNDLKLKNLNSSQELGLQSLEQTLSSLNNIEDKLKALREEFLLGSEDLVNRETEVIKDKIEIKKKNIKKYESFVENSSVSVKELNNY